jgi:hypothetical protein
MQTTLGTLIADFETSLATKMAVGATTVTLLNATDDDGVALPTGRYFLTLDGGNSSKEHISCTLTGTSLTDIKTLSRQGVETSGCLRAHRVGAKVVLTDWAHLKIMNNLLNGDTKFNASTPLEYDGTTTPTTDNQIVPKSYVDGVSIAGGAKASTTVYGLAKTSVAPVSAVDPIVVGTNDGRVPTQDENDALVGTSGTPSTSNKFVTDADATTAKTASKIARRDANGDVLVSTTPTSGDAAASKTYVDNSDSHAHGIATTPTSNGTQTIAHGLGRIPRKIKITLLHGNSGGSTGTMAESVGVYNGVTTSTIFTWAEQTFSTMQYGGRDTSTTNVIYGRFSGYQGSGSWNVTATAVFDNTNITLTYTSTNGSAMPFIWEAE